MENYLFSAQFQSVAKIIVPSDRDKNMAIASLDSLKGLLPKNVNPLDDPDFLYFAANAAQAGRMNLNHDLLDCATALRIYRKSNKYIGVDHEKYVVGVMLYPGISEYGTSELIDEAKANELSFFNLSLVGIVWRAIDQELVNTLIETADPTSANYGKASLSWEIWFRDYSIGVGEGILKNDVLVTKENDKEEFDKLFPLLKCNGGPGKLKDKNIYRVISGPEVIIGGYSWVRHPAASVHGLTLIDKKDEPAIEKEDKELSPKQETPNDKSKTLAELSNPAIIIEGSSYQCSFKSLSDLLGF